MDSILETETSEKSTILRPRQYGVCDSPEHFLKKYPKFDDFIWFCPVWKSKQSESGGWRWHKWGVYVGEHEDLPEYLYDSDVEVQYLFKIGDKEPQQVLGMDPYTLHIVKEGKFVRSSDYQKITMNKHNEQIFWLNMMALSRTNEDENQK